MRSRSAGDVRIVCTLLRIYMNKIPWSKWRSVKVRPSFEHGSPSLEKKQGVNYTTYQHPLNETRTQSTIAPMNIPYIHELYQLKLNEVCLFWQEDYSGEVFSVSSKLYNLLEIDFRNLIYLHVCHPIMPHVFADWQHQHLKSKYPWHIRIQTEYFAVARRYCVYVRVARAIWSHEWSNRIFSSRVFIPWSNT